MNKYVYLILVLLVSIGCSKTQLNKSYYVDSTHGNDEADGTSLETAWKTLDRVNIHMLSGGDSILFQAGQTFVGQLRIMNEGGSVENPSFIGKVGDGPDPVLDGDGHMSSIHIENSENLVLRGLKIKNDSPQSQPGDSKKVRYGIYLENSRENGNTMDNINLSQLSFTDIYPTIAVNDNDQTGVNGHAILVFGAKKDDPHTIHFKNMLIEDCFFTKTARHATVFRSVEQLTIRNNLFEHVGGAGMVIGNHCTDILIENNITDHTGSSIDERMAGRGSGVWCFRTKNLMVQNNKFMYARGIKDSYGMHIDIGNRNVVYQYNYSLGNEGGFVEILGENLNVGYRYNISIADGWRKRGGQLGKTFWISGWGGKDRGPVGSDSVFVYNNSVFIPDTIAPGIEIVKVTKNTWFFNNIVYASNGFGPINILNDAAKNRFDYNIWHGDIPDVDSDGEHFRGTHSLTGNPLYQIENPLMPDDFILRVESPALNSGATLLYEVEDPSVFFHKSGGKDFFGNNQDSGRKPNIGAYQGQGK